MKPNKHQLEKLTYDSKQNCYTSHWKILSKHRYYLMAVLSFMNKGGTCQIVKGY